MSDTPSAAVRGDLRAEAEPPPPVRCADWTREQQVDPVGTAASAEQFVLVEWPLPWPARVEDVEDLAPLLDTAARTGTRVQLVVPRPDRQRSEVVFHHRPGSEGFAGFERRAVQVRPREVVSVACELLEHPAVADPTPDESDVLVCAHGSRDPCCGSTGTGLALALAGAAWDVDGVVHVRRTSHTGGHRFAPTTVFLPTGTVWAYCDEALVERVLRRAGDVRDVLGRYRGSAALAGSAEQAVERSVFAEVGWSWLDWSRTVEELSDGSVRVTGVAPDGVRRCWEGSVEPGRVLPVPECRQPITDAKKSSTEVQVTSLVRVE